MGFTGDGYIANDEAISGIYLIKTNGSVKMEIFIKKDEHDISFWKPSDIKFLTDELKDILTQVFIQNKGIFKNDYIQRKIHTINGLYMLKTKNNNVEVKINIGLCQCDSGTWYDLDIFNSDLINHINYFILNL